MKKFLFFIFCGCCISISSLAQLPVACVSMNPPHICPGTCTAYLNCSTNATTYLWIFPGANPSTSNDLNPVNICYSTPGIYDVTLVAINSFGSDTLFLPNYLTVYPTPPQITIEYCVDTLFATSGFISYQWYMNGMIIPGATDSIYIATQSADYNVVAADINGCEVEAVIFQAGGGYCNCCSRIDEYNSGITIQVYPNPVAEKLMIDNLKSAKTISIFNALGEKVLEVSQLRDYKAELNVSTLPGGMYYLNLEMNDRTERTKFIKQ